MERKRRAWEPQSAGDLPCGKAVRRVPHKKAEDIKPRFLR